MDLGPARGPIEANLHVPTEVTWLQPVPDALVADPAELAISGETIKLAFVAALQHLPPRQRAVLILREVLRWQASEVAELLDTTVASVNSALQRARETLDKASTGTVARGSERGRPRAARAPRRGVQDYDMDALTALIQEDATQSMPPFDLWLRGRDDILTWWFGPGLGCQGSRVVPAGSANGSPAYGQYKPSPDGGFDPWALQVIEVVDGRIAEFSFFLDTATLFPLFGLPPRPRGVAHSGSTFSSPMKARSLSSSSGAFRSRTTQVAPARCELKPRERVNRHGIRADGRDVAVGDVGGCSRGSRTHGRRALGGRRA
jgi:RNA polymerase sigma-70 factor (ECF subfamily)